jgi:hypothetical protein
LTYRLLPSSSHFLASSAVGREAAYACPRAIDTPANRGKLKDERAAPEVKAPALTKALLEIEFGMLGPPLIPSD